MRDKREKRRGGKKKRGQEGKSNEGEGKSLCGGLQAGSLE